MVRKDVWRLRPGGKVKFQVRFGEYGGAYVTHCHNTVHEDNAMLMRYDILMDNPSASDLHASIIPTPETSPDGVTYRTPEILPEADPSNPEFFQGDGDGSGSAVVEDFGSGERVRPDRLNRPDRRGRRDSRGRRRRG